MPLSSLSLSTRVVGAFCDTLFDENIALAASKALSASSFPWTSFVVSYAKTSFASFDVHNLQTLFLSCFESILAIKSQNHVNTRYAFFLL